MDRQNKKNCIVNVLFKLLTNLKPKLNNTEHAEVLGSLDVPCLFDVSIIKFCEQPNHINNLLQSLNSEHRRQSETIREMSIRSSPFLKQVLIVDV
jgi:hypothetical protein